MVSTIEKKLQNLLENECRLTLLKIEPLPAHGSDRTYYRLFTPQQTLIGAHNRDRAENTAFISFSRHFLKHNLPVPQIHAEDPAHDIYIMQDLGDITLFEYLEDLRRGEKDFPQKIISLYETVVGILPQFQITAARDFNYTLCYPRHSFDKQSMMWDLNYFKYYFLKLAHIPFDEQKLEDDFQTFADFLLSTRCDYFLYRDFQSRNIMLVDNQPFFIDYQGGRRGALHYDIASLLYDAKADIPREVRDHLLQKYMAAVAKHTPIEMESFITYYHGYVLIRIMQALGAYGFRGFYERKEHFLKSVPYAIQNLEYILQSVRLPLAIPVLTDAWQRLIQSAFLRQLGEVSKRLKIRIQSFSYKRGIPLDEKGHGGGFVLDCRALPNPGRYPEYSAVNGNDAAVIEYLQSKPEVSQFLNHTFDLLDPVILHYQQRSFTDLLVAFGCTGGQHRSVYCANRLAEHLKTKYDIDIDIRHLELEAK
jgi:aminoglycoside/choline kinase family phosphotransferase